MSIEDQIEQYNLTVPHSQSVISSTVEEYDNQLYRLLTAMESYTYTHSNRPSTMTGGVGSGKAGLSEYRDFWRSYNDALMGYLTHTAISKGLFKDLIQGLFGYMHVSSRGYGDGDTLVRSDAKKIFTLDNLLESLSDKSIDHYDDYLPEDPMPASTGPEPPDPIPESSLTLEADVAKIEQAWDQDVAKINTLLDEYAEAISDCTTDALFADGSEPVVSPSGGQIWDTVFIQLNWKWYAEYFNSDLNIPPKPVPKTKKKFE